MSDTHFAILRVERVKTIADLAGADRHGRREDTGTHFDPERTPTNQELFEETKALCEEVGRPIATGEQTRQILDLPSA